MNTIELLKTIDLRLDLEKTLNKDGTYTLSVLHEHIKDAIVKEEKAYVKAMLSML